MAYKVDMFISLLLEYDNPKVEIHSHYALNISDYQQQKQTMSMDRNDVHRLLNATGLFHCMFSNESKDSDYETEPYFAASCTRNNQA